MPSYGAEYQVRNGDTLSYILYRWVPGNIYGPNGNLEKTKQLNPGLSSLDVIRPGSKIVLPKGDLGPTQFEIAQGIKPLNRTPVSDPEASKKSPETSSLLQLAPVSDKKPNTDPAVAQPLPPTVKKKKPTQAITAEAVFASQSLKASEKDSTSTQTLISNVSYGAKLKWTQIWYDNFKVSLGAELMKYSFTTSDTLTLDNKDHDLIKYSVRGDLQANPGLLIGLELGYKDVLFVDSSESNVVNLQSRSLPMTSLEIRKHLLKTSNGFTIGAKASATYFLSTSQSDFDTDSSTGLGLGAYSSYQTESLSYQLSLSYQPSSLESDNVTQSNKEIQAGLSLSYDF